VLWLVAVLGFGTWIVWHFARQLYTAAMFGYVRTGVPERRLQRDEFPSLFRNNVIANIALFPTVTAGCVILLLDALRAVNFIR